MYRLYPSAGERYTLSRPIVSIICIDNYEELTKSATDSEKSSILAEIDRKIAQWAKDSRSLLRKYDRDKYIFVLESGDLSKLASKKFSVLDDVRTMSKPCRCCGDTFNRYWPVKAKISPNVFIMLVLHLTWLFPVAVTKRLLKQNIISNFLADYLKNWKNVLKLNLEWLLMHLCSLIRESSRVMIMGHQTSDMDSSRCSAVGMACAVKTHG